MTVPLSLANLNVPPTAEQWNDALISIQQTLGLPTTTWQPGGVERTIDASVANIQQQSDVAASIMVQAGFLTFASSGFVTYTDATGATITLLVTPDPSDPAQNPTGALGWLDVLADSVYNVQRILSAPAGGQLALLNTSVTTYGSYAEGTYHVALPTGPTYANTAALSIPPSATVGTVSATANSAGLIKITTSSAHGLTTGDYAFITGVGGTTESNGAWVVTVTNSTQFTLDGSVYANAYTSGGTVYTPTVAEFTADASGTASDADPNTVTVVVTSLSGVSVSNIDAWNGADTESNSALEARCRLKLAALAVGVPGGELEYYALVSQELAPDLTPALAVSAPITRALVTLERTTGEIFVTIANAAGGPGAQDVAAVQAVEDAYAGITANTVTVQAAANNAMTAALTVFLPAAYNTTTNRDYFKTAVENYGKALRIGGVTDSGGASPNTNVVPYNAVLGAVWRAAKVASIPLQQVEGTLDSGTANVQLALTPIPEVAVFTVTVTLVSV
jgi:hypothetical protein